MTIHKIIAILLAMYSSISITTVFSFEETQGVLVKFFSPDEPTPLFYTKGVDIMQDSVHGYMVTAKYFKTKGFYPVGIIIHNKSNDVVKISASSIGSQQRSVDDIVAQCS